MLPRTSLLGPSSGLLSRQEAHCPLVEPSQPDDLRACQESRFRGGHAHVCSIESPSVGGQLRGTDPCTIRPSRLTSCASCWSIWDLRKPTHGPTASHSDTPTLARSCCFGR